jgi:hypothetical protein
MEIAGLSLAANILQTVQFSLNVLSVIRKIHKDTDAFPGYDSIRLTTNDLITWIRRMQASAALGNDSIDTSTLTLYKLCLSTSDDLMELLDKLKVKPNSKMRVAMRQSLLAFSSKEHINELENRIKGIRQEILLSEILRLRLVAQCHVKYSLTSHNREGMIDHGKILDSIQNDVTRMLKMLEERPKAIGYPGYTADNQLKIDDGLGPEYFLPVELCSEPEVRKFEPCLCATHESTLINHEYVEFYPTSQNAVRITKVARFETNHTRSFHTPHVGRTSRDKPWKLGTCPRTRKSRQAHLCNWHMEWFSARSLHALLQAEKM